MWAINWKNITGKAIYRYNCLLNVEFVILIKRIFKLLTKHLYLLQLYKKIDGHEISWALGCAYNLLTQQLKKNWFFNDFFDIIS